MKLILFVTLILAFSSKLYSDSSIIYKSYDKDGNPVYSDREPDAKYEIVKKISTKKSPAKEETVESLPAARDMESIRTITNTAQQDINAIYETLYDLNKDINGKVAVTFSVDQKGKVVNCTEDESAMSLASFNGKICEKINNLNYGEVEKKETTTVKYTYEFGPKN